MARSLKAWKPSFSEMLQLCQMLEQAQDPRLGRMAEIALFYAAGLSGIQIAEAVDLHPNTVYAYLGDWSRAGCPAASTLPRLGAPARLTAEQHAEIGRLAEPPPAELGLPYGRWSLSNLQAYLTEGCHVLTAISREHLRRILKKRGSSFVGSSAS